MCLDVFRLYDKNAGVMREPQSTLKGTKEIENTLRSSRLGFPVQKFHNSPCKLKSSCGIIITNVCIFL